MEPETPETEPRAFIAGETVEWSKSFEDYSAADGWSLKYSGRGPGTAFDITAAADGTAFLTTITSSSSDVTPGTWRLVGWVEKGNEKHFVYDEDLIVVAKPATSGTLDTRTIAKQIVDLIDAFILAGPLASSGVKRYRIADRDLEYCTTEELIKLRTYYWNIYVSQKRKGKEFRNIRCTF